VSPTCCPFHSGKGSIARIDREQVTNGGDVRLQLPHTPHALLNLGNNLRLAVHLVDLKILSELLDERQKGTGLTKGDAVALQPGDRLPCLFLQ
jgi:hypothetical protein